MALTLPDGPGKIEVRAARDDDREAWDAIAASSDDAWLTHSWRWNEAIERQVMGGEPRSLVVVCDGRIVGIVPQHLHKEARGPVSRQVLYANFWAGGGLALANDLTSVERERCAAAVRATVEAQARRDGTDKILLFLPPLSRRNLRGDSEARRALEQGFVDRSTRALVVRLAGRSKQDVWDGMEGRARTKARKAQRAGVSVTRVSTLTALDSLYALHEETFRRTGGQSYPRAYFESTLGMGDFHVFFGELDGKTIAAITIALYGGRALFHASASTAEALRVGCNNLLMWRALEWLVDEGAEACELGLLPEPNKPKSTKIESIAYHHRSFGGVEVPAYIGHHVFRPEREAVFSLANRVISTVGWLRRDDSAPGNILSIAMLGIGITS